MNNTEILKIALEQSAADSSCRASDFLESKNKVVISRKNDNARKYLDLPFQCDLTSYGNNIVASVSSELTAVVGEYIDAYPKEHCFETPNMLVLMEKLKPYNLNVCFMAEYFLPDTELIKKRECGYELRIMKPSDFHSLYTSEWKNALCKDRKELDMIAVGAFEGNKLIGLAGASADCDMMWQIGVDILPEYRKQGIASALTSNLACEILSIGKVPFYCCAWSNIGSARNAIKCGFRPAWVQLTAKSNEFINKMNEK